MTVVWSMSANAAVLHTTRIQLLACEANVSHVGVSSKSTFDNGSINSSS